MSRATFEIALIISTVIATVIVSATGPASAFNDMCERDYAQCTGSCEGLPGKGTEGSRYEACIGRCGLMFVNCFNPPSSSGSSNAQPGNTTNPPPKGVIEQPPATVGTEQPPGSTPPPKPGLPPPGIVGVNKQPVGDGGTTPPGLIGVHPVYPVNPVVNQPVTGTTGNGSGEQIFAKSGAGQQNVQDLIKSWQQKVNDKNSVLYNGQTPRGAGSVTPNVNSQIFNQSNQTSALGGSGKQKLQNEMLHVDKEKSNVQNFSSPAASHAHGGRR